MSYRLTNRLRYKNRFGMYNDLTLNSDLTYPLIRINIIKNNKIY